MADLRRRRLCMAAVFVSLLVLAGCGASPPPKEGAAPGAPSALTAASGEAPQAPRPSGSAARAVHSRASSPTRIAFVNVGQGDAILIRSGSADVLIDGGPEGSDRNRGRRHETDGHEDLDTIVVSHLHADHIGGERRAQQGL